MSKPTTAWPEHPCASNIRRSRFMYAWMANSLAVMILFVTAIAMWTNEFRTLGEIDVAVSGSDVDPEQLESHIVDALKRASSDESLRQTIQLALNDGNDPAAGMDREEPDYDLLRQKIKYVIEDRPEQDQVAVYLELRGTGTAQERKLLQGITERVREIVDFEMTDSGQQVTQWQARSERTRKIVSDAQVCFDVCKKTLTQVVDQLEVHQTAVVTEAGRNAQLRTELQWLDGELKQEFGESSDEYAGFRSRFRELVADQDTIADLGSDTTGNFLLTSSDRGNTPARLVALGELRADASAMPLTELSLLLNEAAASVSQPMLGAAAVSASPDALDAAQLRVQRIGAVTNEPVGALSEKGVLLCILLSSLVIGWVLSSNINPQSFDAGFQKSHSIEAELSVPVVAEMSPLDAKAPVDPRADWQFNILHFSELILLTTVMLFGALFIANLELREAILNNPLHAFSRVVWSITH